MIPQVNNPTHPSAPPKTSFQILPATPADLPTMMLIQFSAMSHEAYHHFVYPGGNTSASRLTAETRRLPDLSRPSNLFIKAVERDPVSGDETIVGWALWKVAGRKETEEKWMHPTAEQIREEIDWVEKGTWQWEASAEFFEGLTGMRQRWIKGQAHLLLDLCMTDPAHQRRGVGKALVQWGTRLADEMGVPALLEATKAGRRLYEQNGFRMVDEFVVDCGKWPQLVALGAKGKVPYVLMVRMQENLGRL